MSIRGLLSVEQLEELSRVFAGKAAWSFALYEPLRAFAHAFPRLGLHDAPEAIHFGDALSALNQVLALQGTPSWRSSGSITPVGFEALGYASTSAGITSLQGQHRATWREHAERNKALLLRGAELGGKHALVLGAGKLYDVPLRQLGERFERLTLVDIDAESLQHSVEHSGVEPDLRARLVLVQSDVTGINDAFVSAVDGIFETNGDEDTTYTALLLLLHSYRLAPPPQLVEATQLGKPRIDAVFSTMLLSQLATPLTRYLERRYSQRFPASERLASHELQVGLGQLTHRVQHSHLEALLACAPRVVVTSDMWERISQRAPRGIEPVSTELPLLGAPHLEELFPLRSTRLIESAEWDWHRIPPSRHNARGRSLRVGGCVVEQRPA